MDETHPGARVRALRKERGWTQADLAYRAKVDQSSVSRLERQVLIPETATLQRIADSFEVPLTELLGAGGGESRVERIDVDPAWAKSVDAYLRSDFGRDTPPDIAEALQHVHHKSFRLRPGVMKDVHRARELLETQARELAAETPDEDAQGFRTLRVKARR